MNYAFKDILDSFHKLPMAFYFAWGDTVARYRRSILGPFWLVLGTAIGILGLGWLWGRLLKVDYDVFIPSLTIGLVVWQFIASSIVEGRTSFIRNAALIRNVKTPYLIFPVQVLLRQLINFAHNLIVVVGVLIVFSSAVSWVTLLVIPNLVLVIMNLLWMVLLIGLLGARFRDMEQLIAAVMPILFFLSPVIYRPDQLGIKSAFVWFNPFSHMISLLRFPLQGSVPPTFVYVVMMTMAVVGWSIALWFLNRKYGRIAFWV
jgi:ABC-type polysaccharide/polyol phosphate export permease